MERTSAYIWGAAKYGEYALKHNEERFHIIGFVDKRACAAFNRFCARPVISPDQFFEEHQSDAAIILAVRYPAEVLEIIARKLSQPKVYIFDGRSAGNFLLYEVRDGEICVPEYMDKRFGEWKEYADHYSRLNPFIFDMFSAALGWISRYEKDIEICEIGCGSGQFANMLFDHGYSNYQGIDFSSQAIGLAKAANPGYADRFICQDAFSYFGSNPPKTTDLFVLFEVLEHIKKDIELLNMLPPPRVGEESFSPFRTLKALTT